MRVAIIAALLALASTASAQPTMERVRVQLEETETSSFQLARLVSAHLAMARRHQHRRQARCFDGLLSEVHALGRQVRATRTSSIEPERLSVISRTLTERLDRLRRDARVCHGHERVANRTVVTMEIEPGTPTED